MCMPYGIAIDSSNRVYISDWKTHSILVYTSKGMYVTSFGGKGREQGQFNLPAGLAVDDSGVLYVCDYGNNRVQII